MLAQTCLPDKRNGHHIRRASLSLWLSLITYIDIDIYIDKFICIAF